jgi:hypothetical protein
MRDQRTPGRADEPADPNVLQHSVLHVVLGHHPAQLRFDELARACHEEEFLVKDAVDDLVADGLLQRHGEFVLATRAAVRFDELGT